MWIKRGDYFGDGVTTTELIWISDKTDKEPLMVDPESADTIMQELNEYHILKTILNNHYKDLQEMHKHPETFKDVMMSNLFMTYLHDVQKIFKGASQKMKENREWINYRNNYEQSRIL